MDLSVFLAKVLGLYLLIFAADLLLRRKELEGAVKNFSASAGLLLFSGSVSLFLGLVIVIAHPVYEMDWRGFITFLGYLMILRGVLRLVFPTAIRHKLAAAFHRRYWAVFVILLIFGLYLTYSGFSTA